ncbi:conserved oligomeric Golgi complex subunit 1 isoform X1 [Vespula pensylvanica]|uniref:conserved oligomeric Golgi complex subunit 1 isoform X1 n=1 Tax=Vespula pensylvanica TaxID=30213 RepID=UPI001CBA02C3|nr:conserved oligomeric Golgi complex subunit 1 isoform X1 [Vespula pensylvanica]
MKMTTINYLDLDINKLFEQHTIKEIEEIQKKIQLESDRKKIELRTLVGERYRDLILAADTIGKMKITAERISLRIARTEEKFQELQEKYLIGFKTDSVENEPDRKSEDMAAVIIQIKILMDIPEFIWSNIESQNLLYATQLFILAQHIKYRLKFEIGNEELTLKYPIVFKQWDIIGQFKNIILRECDTILRSWNVSTESAANCLASLILLNKTPYKDLLEKLIFTRCRAVESIIKDENDYNVKTKIKLCIEMLIHTITLIYACFITAGDKQEGLVSQYIALIKDEKVYSLLSKIDVNKDLIQKYLSSVITNEKPFLQEGDDKFSILDLQECVKAWLNWLQEFCNTEVVKLFQLIISVKGLYSIREEAVGINLPENWNIIWEDFGLPNISYWLEFFQPLLSQRAKNIIHDKWLEAMTNLKTNISEILNKVTRERCEFPEHDLRWFVWKDSPSDIPQKLTHNIGLDSKRSLLMKTKGYSPNVVQLCEDFDNSLYELLSDLEQYLYDTVCNLNIKDNLLSKNISVIPNTFSDRAEIQDHLQNVSTTMIEDFTRYVKDTYINNNTNHNQQEINTIVLARLLMAFTSLSPNLNKCFNLSKATGLSITNTKWQTIVDTLKEESISIWSVWANKYRSKLSDHKEKYMSKELFDGLKIKSVLSDWEKVMIEEESGEGKTLKTEILVPYQPSIMLQKFLMAVIKDLNKIIPHTIPKKVLHEIIEAIVSELFNYYQDTSNIVDLKQKQALQIVFDIKYCTLLMVPRENKHLNEMSSKATDSTLSKIDPFDYNVINPFIHTNVKKSVLRSLLLLGNLIPHLEQLHSVLGGRSEYNTGEGNKLDSPALLALCTGAPWFPPLAITVPMRNLSLVTTTIQDKTQRKKVPSSKDNTKTESAGSTIKSGAAAFFGAMGSDWFSAS